LLRRKVDRSGFLPIKGKMPEDERLIAKTTFMSIPYMPMESFVRQKNFRIVFLLVLCYFSFFLHNHLIYADIMECRNLVTAREIVEEGHWLVPRMNGELRLEKPPLPTWIAAVVETMVPDCLPLQRALAGGAATMFVFFFYGLVNLLSGNRTLGFVAAIVLCTSFSMMLMGRTVTWDIYCHAFMTGALYFIVKGGVKTGKAGWEFAAGGMFLGLSFLSKGPVAFYALLLPFVLAYLLVKPRSWMWKDRRGAIVLLPVMALVIGLWWPLLLYWRYPEMTAAAWDKETTAWVERNVRPWYYYWKFFLESGIWAGMLLTSLWGIFRQERGGGERCYRFAWGWIGMILICLSLLPEKKTRYLLPVLIPSACAVACLFMDWMKRIKEGFSLSDRLLFRTNVWLIAMLAVVLPVGMYVWLYQTGNMGLCCLIFSSLLCWGVAVCLSFSAFRCRPWGFLLGTVALLLTVELWVLPCVTVFFNNPEIHSIRAVRQMNEIRGIPFYHDVREGLRIEIVYEAGRKILPHDFSAGIPALPFVLVSEEAAEKLLPEKFCRTLEFKLLGIFDDNKRPAGTRWHSSKFVRRVTKVEESGKNSLEAAGKESSKK